MFIIFEKIPRFLEISLDDNLKKCFFFLFIRISTITIRSRSSAFIVQW